jgi:cytochrome c-type biogenesis protein CcmE
MTDPAAGENMEEPASSHPAFEVAAASRRADETEEDDDNGARKRLLLVVPLLMAAAAIVALVLVGMQDKGIYSKPVDGLVAEKAKFIGKAVRAEGLLVHGSLLKREDPCEYRFKVEKNNVEVPVRFAKCVVPDTFRDVPGTDVAVTVEGVLQSDGSLEASQVLAKCPSKYEMKQRAAQGEKAPHAAMNP